VTAIPGSKEESWPAPSRRSLGGSPALPPGKHAAPRRRERRAHPERGTGNGPCQGDTSSERPPPAPATRPGFMSSVRARYHPAHVREDIRLLPTVLTPGRSSWQSAVLVGAVAQYLFPATRDRPSPGADLPGSALAPSWSPDSSRRERANLLGYHRARAGRRFVRDLHHPCSRPGSAASCPPTRSANLLVLVLHHGRSAARSSPAPGVVTPLPRALEPSPAAPREAPRSGVRRGASRAHRSPGARRHRRRQTA